MDGLEYDTDALDAYCDGVESGGDKAPICMVYLGLSGVSEGLNVFFLLFAVSLIALLPVCFVELSCAHSEFAGLG
jgi:hypothetical protein